jgi:hypothetical protein
VAQRFTAAVNVLILALGACDLSRRCPFDRNRRS